MNYAQQIACKVLWRGIKKQVHGLSLHSLRAVSAVDLLEDVLAALGGFCMNDREKALNRVLFLMSLTLYRLEQVLQSSATNARKA